MRFERITESRATEISMCAQDASLLRLVGEKMASAARWWGNPEPGAPWVSKSMIQVQPAGSGRFSVNVANMIGVIRLNELQLEIAPKIPERHFLHLAARAILSPRECGAGVFVGTDTAFLEVVARWCLEAVEALLRQGLRFDYQTTNSELPAVRGHVLAYQTSMELLRGRPVATCVFDELSEDAPLNRVIKAACQALAAQGALSDATRRRARRVAYRLNCSELRPSDLLVRPDRVARAYGRAWSLAMLILRGMSVSFRAGQNAGTSFLIRTPELIEDGLRVVVSESLPRVVVAKRRLTLASSRISVNPDLTFNGNWAVGDIKYRKLDSDWNRSDLYQAVSFATAFRAKFGLVLGFANEQATNLPASVKLGDVAVRCIAWCASDDLEPIRSAELFSQELRNWWCAVDCETKHFAIDQRA